MQARPALRRLACMASSSLRASARQATLSCCPPPSSSFQKSPTAIACWAGIGRNQGQCGCFCSRRPNREAGTQNMQSQMSKGRKAARRTVASCPVLASSCLDVDPHCGGAGHWRTGRFVANVVQAVGMRFVSNEHGIASEWTDWGET
eukprot:2670033-Rhodomonas_salina.2